MKPKHLLVVGGYGIVGSQFCQMFHDRNPDVRLQIAGRSAEKAQSFANSLAGAAGLQMDVTELDPLDRLEVLPDAIVVAVNDDHDKLLSAAIARGIAIVDIARWTSRMDDAVRIAEQLKPQAPVVLASGWMAGAVAAAINASRHGQDQFGQIDIDILFYAADKAGPDSIAGWVDIHRPFQIWQGWQRREVRSLADPRRQSFPSGRSAKTRRFSAPDQESLVRSGLASGVAVRMAFDSPLLTNAFVLLVHTGLWGLLSGEARKKLLYNPGKGAAHEIVVTLDDSRKLMISDQQGQTHLTACGALIQAERMLSLHGRKAPRAGVSYPEQASDPDADLATLRSLGVDVITAK